jgi:hypothetical protein
MVLKAFFDKFMQGIAAVFYVIPVTLRFYPFHAAEKAITFDFTSVGDDIYVSCKKYDEKMKNEGK